MIWLAIIVVLGYFKYYIIFKEESKRRSIWCLSLKLFHWTHFISRSCRWLFQIFSNNKPTLNFVWIFYESIFFTVNCSQFIITYGPPILNSKNEKNRSLMHDYHCVLTIFPTNLNWKSSPVFFHYSRAILLSV